MNSMTATPAQMDLAAVERDADLVRRPAMLAGSPDELPEMTMAELAAEVASAEAFVVSCRNQPGIATLTPLARGIVLNGLNELASNLAGIRESATEIADIAAGVKSMLSPPEPRSFPMLNHEPLPIDSNDELNDEELLDDEGFGDEDSDDDSFDDEDESFDDDFDDDE